MRRFALNNAAWNYPCHIVDMETGDIVFQAKAYNHEFAISLLTTGPDRAILKT